MDKGEMPIHRKERRQLVEIVLNGEAIIEMDFVEISV